MGMNLGRASGIRVDINITPLVDVVLVLLIIFLVAMPISMTQMPVDVPRAVEPGELSGAPITVRVHEDMTVKVSSRAGVVTVQATELARTLRPLVHGRVETGVVFVDFDDAVPWTEAMSIMDTIRGLGVGADRAVAVALQVR